jgi:hypothetical protein
VFNVSNRITFVKEGYKKLKKKLHPLNQSSGDATARAYARVAELPRFFYGRTILSKVEIMINVTLYNLILTVIIVIFISDRLLSCA